MNKRDLVLWACFIFLVVIFGISVYAFIKSGVLRNLRNNTVKQTTSYANGTYKVTSISDGDTIEVDMNGVTERVRFIGIDTPETHKPNIPVQCFGPEASDYTTQRLKDSYVRLETDPLSSNRDRYDRLLRYVYIDNELLNQAIVATGHGFAYTPFEFSKKDEFIAAETNAKNMALGLWGACSVVIENGVMQTIFKP